MFYLILFLIINVVYGEYTFWSPDGVKKLWCPDMNELIAEFENEIEVNQSCACDAHPLWEVFTNVSYHALSIEIMDPKAERTKLFDATSFLSDSTVFRFTHIDGILRTFPENSCQFDIVYIDVTNNRFIEIGNLSCFYNLDTLIMKGNLISFVSNETFHEMIHLRKVDLSNNRINKMDLNVLSTSGFLHFNLASNQLHEIDVTNMFALNRTLCGVSFAQNKHSVVKITNMLDVQLGENDFLMCNDVDLSGVFAQPLPITRISENIPDSRELLRYTPCGVLKCNGSGLDCGCDLAVFYPIEFNRAADMFFKNDLGYLCNLPEELKGINAKHAYENKTLRDQMTCPVQDYCESRPECKCTCTDQPTKKRLLVDCSNQSCTRLPEVLPNSRYPVWLNVTYNNIKHVLFKNYTSRIQVLDLGNNSVEHLDENLGSMRAASKIILVNHSLKTLPKSIQNLHPDVFRFGNSGIPCNCENNWIGEWRKIRKASKKYPLYCSNYHNVLIEDMADSLSECTESDNSTWWPFSFVLPFLPLIMVLLYTYFRFDFLLLKRRLLGTNKNDRNKWDNDVYISFDDNNVDIRYYVLQILDPFLRRNAITTYIPCRDELGGCKIEETITLNLQKSKYLLIIQSKGMYENFDRQIEYKLGWHYYIGNALDKILILNFDNSSDRFQRTITRALNRWNMVFMVTNRKQSLKTELLKAFDTPLINYTKHLKQRTRGIMKELG